MLATISPVHRMCGEYRTVGRIYVMTHLSRDPQAMPLEHFLIDPVLPVPDLESLGLTKIGMTIRPAHDRPGVFDLYDWIGREYVNVWDYLIEGQTHGFSALAAKTIDFSKLSRRSRRICIHPRALLHNALDYTDVRQGTCPTGKLACSNQGGQLCVGLPREATLLGELHGDKSRVVTRFLPDTQHPQTRYDGWHSPDGVKPLFGAAAFIQLPITNLEVVQDNEAGTHVAAMNLLRSLGTDLQTTLEAF